MAGGSAVACHIGCHIGCRVGCHLLGAEQRDPIGGGAHPPSTPNETPATWGPMWLNEARPAESRGGRWV
jgi:hypothetical protein